MTSYILPVLCRQRSSPCLECCPVVQLVEQRVSCSERGCHYLLLNNSGSSIANDCIWISSFSGQQLHYFSMALVVQPGSRTNKSPHSISALKVLLLLFSVQLKLNNCTTWYSMYQGGRNLPFILYQSFTFI